MVRLTVDKVAPHFIEDNSQNCILYDVPFGIAGQQDSKTVGQLSGAIMQILGQGADLLTGTETYIIWILIHKAMFLFLLDLIELSAYFPEDLIPERNVGTAPKRNQSDVMKFD